MGDALSRLRHPHILLFLGAITNTQPCFIVMEFAERGSLFDVLGHIALPTTSEKEGNFAPIMCPMDTCFSATFQELWKTFAKITFEVSLGLNHAHLCSYIHGDIKSLNILLMADGSAKLSDFGMSKFSLGNDTFNPSSVSIPWAAPEILNQESGISKAADSYAFGIVMWELAMCKRPFGDLKTRELLPHIQKGERPSVSGILECPVRSEVIPSQ